jgi:hypothetical protein
MKLFNTLFFFALVLLQSLPGCNRVFGQTGFAGFPSASATCRHSRSG